MPHEVLSMVMTHVESLADEPQELVQAWQMAIQWCVVVAQHDTQGDSLVAFNIEAITETDDDNFSRWAERRIDGTMGVKPTTAGGGDLAQGSTHPQAQGHLAMEVGRRLVLGLQALGPLKPLSRHQGGGEESDPKPLYTKEDIAAIMGFSHVKRGLDLQDIWTYFQLSKGKNIDVCQRQLMARMMQWSHDQRISINTSVYLESTTIKAIIELKFNPGKGMAHLSSVDKGLPIMACRARTSVETERIRERKEALSVAETTRQLDELLRLPNCSTRAPADNFGNSK